MLLLVIYRLLLKFLQEILEFDCIESERFASLKGWKEGPEGVGDLLRRFQMVQSIDERLDMETMS